MPEESDSKEEKKESETSVSSFFSTPAATPFVFFSPSSSLEISDRPFNFNRFVDLAHQLSSSSMRGSSSASSSSSSPYDAHGGAPAQWEGRSPSSLSRKKRLLHSPSPPSHPGRCMTSATVPRLSPERDLKQLMGPSTSFYFRLDNAGYVPSFSSSAETGNPNSSDACVRFPRGGRSTAWGGGDDHADRRGGVWPSPLVPPQVKQEMLEQAEHTAPPPSHDGSGKGAAALATSSTGLTSAMESKKKWLETIGSLYQYGSILYEPSSGAYWCWCYTVLERKPIEQYLASFAGEDEGVCCDFCGWTEWVHARDPPSESTATAPLPLESFPTLEEYRRTSPPSFPFASTRSTMTRTVAGNAFSTPDDMSSTSHRKRVRSAREEEEGKKMATGLLAGVAAVSPPLDSAIPSLTTFSEVDREKGKQERSPSEQFFFHCPSCGADFCPRCCDDVKKDDRYHIPDMILLPIARGVKKEKG